MLFVLSPAKTLDFESPLPELPQAPATPRLNARAAELIGLLREKSPAQVATLMDLSDALATLNVARYAAWRPRHTDRNSRPALYAFNGDVYEGLSARSLTPRQVEWAQQHLVMLSGLYGLLRPLDRIQPYRLEMGTALPNPAGAHLYHYWGSRIAEELNRLAAAEKTPVVVNLASQEYFRAVDRQTLRAQVVECVFEEWRGGRPRIISFAAKRARGLMARWAIEHRAATPARLRDFDTEGYAFDEAASDAGRLVFRRPGPAA